MRKCTTLQKLTILVSCLFAMPSFAEGNGLCTGAMASPSQQYPLTSEESESITDLRAGIITNLAGVEIGAIKDLVFDLEAGRIAYTVGLFDRFRELHDKLFVIPWGVVKLHPALNTFILIGDKGVLEGAPSFSPQTWPALPASQWMTAVDTYWQKRTGSHSKTEHTPEAVLYKASALAGTTVKTPTGEDVGTMEEFVVDSETGLIAYAVLSFDVESDNRTVFFALPWGAMRLDPVQHTLIAHVDRTVTAEIHAILPDGPSRNSPVALSTVGRSIPEGL